MTVPSHSIISSAFDTTNVTYPFKTGTMSASILFEVEGGVAFIRLNRPDKLNAFNRDMAMQLQEKLKSCTTDRSIRAVHLTGMGKAFCAGQDLEEVIDPAGPGMAAILAEHYNPLVRLIREMPKPVVAAVNGVAAGAGANLALCCDIVLASEQASFIQAFSKIGLIPDSGGTYFLPRLVGWQKASALMMLGEKVSAAEAERMGMVYKVIPEDTFASETLATSLKLAQMPTRALALTKQALANSLSGDLEGQLRLEDTLQQEAAGSHDFREGVDAFLEKRPAIFKGE
jgi:2-(1,2-epoxy-1,2-dihydrophenyl)acetyl-CoA isomerase